MSKRQKSRRVRVTGGRLQIGRLRLELRLSWAKKSATPLGSIR